jgi:hypothetical protein
MQPNFTDMNKLNHTLCDSRSCPTLPINRCICYPIVKILEQEKDNNIEKEIDKDPDQKPINYSDLLSIIYNTFFSTGIETIKQKET